jgi:protein-tyrosine phosphatase
VRILFVCTGNICRSPLAEVILRNKIQLLHASAEIDSAGFEAFHDGDHADARAIRTARNHGIDLTAHRARLFTTQDFQHYDHIYIMDDSHMQRIRHFARGHEDMGKVDYIMNQVHPGQDLNVEDPWYDDLPAFERVYVKLDTACGILAERIASGILS